MCILTSDFWKQQVDNHVKFCLSEIYNRYNKINIIIFIYQYHSAQSEYALKFYSHKILIVNITFYDSYIFNNFLKVYLIYKSKMMRKKTMLL